ERGRAADPLAPRAPPPRAVACVFVVRVGRVSACSRRLRWILKMQPELQGSKNHVGRWPTWFSHDFWGSCLRAWIIPNFATVIFLELSARDHRFLRFGGV